MIMLCIPLFHNNVTLFRISLFPSISSLFIFISNRVSPLSPSALSALMTNKDNVCVLRKRERESDCVKETEKQGETKSESNRGTKRDSICVCLCVHVFVSVCVCVDYINGCSLE